MSTSDRIALVGVAAAPFLGLLSLFFSFRANRISAAAEQLAKAAYFAERRVALTSTIGKDDRGLEHLLLAPATSDQTVNNVTLFFPRKLQIVPIALAAGNMRLTLARISPQLHTYWDSRTPPNENYGQVRQNAPVPIAVMVHGHSKGDAVVTLGLYDLYCHYVRVEEKSGHLEVLSLALNNWSLPNADPQDEADRVLAAYEAFAGTSNSPLQPTGSAGA